jgi:hypothetical protein
MITVRARARPRQRPGRGRGAQGPGLSRHARRRAGRAAVGGLLPVLPAAVRRGAAPQPRQAVPARRPLPHRPGRLRDDRPGHPHDRRPGLRELRRPAGSLPGAVRGGRPRGFRLWPATGTSSLATGSGTPPAAGWGSSTGNAQSLRRPSAIWSGWSTARGTAGPISARSSSRGTGAPCPRRKTRRCSATPSLTLSAACGGAWPTADAVVSRAWRTFERSSGTPLAHS